MSASLVGSEMCIRDSFSREDQTATSSSSALTPRPTSQGCGPGQAQPGTCLLYTSDAADDM
eukprot:15149308-Alexandrium_andersonii.AAC.1